MNQKELQSIVDYQAELESLWTDTASITEHMLQAALRHLHAVIEGDEEMAELYKPVYWYVESEL